MLQRKNPDDYVIATGERHSVREFAGVAFSHVSLDYHDYVVVDPQLLAPGRRENLVRLCFGHEGPGVSHRTAFRELVQENGRVGSAMFLPFAIRFSPQVVMILALC